MALAFDAQSSFDLTTSASNTHTPVGTPRAVLVGIAQENGQVDAISGVTYGGVAMTRVTNGWANINSAEVGNAYLYFLGSSIPTGAQSVSITVSTGAQAKTAWCLTFTASADTEVAASAQLSATQTNPSITLGTTAGFTGIAAAILWNAANNPATNAVGSGYTATTNVKDFGADGGLMEYGAKSGASVVVDFTNGTSEETAMVAAAIQEQAAAPSGRPDRMMLMGVS